VTRAVLAFLLCALVLVLALVAAAIQVSNCARAKALADLQRETEMLEAAVEQLEARRALYVTPLETPAPSQEVEAPDASPERPVEVQG